MTIPRCVIPGADYMITRRCSERRFFLRPGPETNNAFIYCLALAADRAKVDLLFVTAMSNHYHGGIHDALGNFPVFTEHFHGLLARCQNTHLGHFEAFWSSDPCSVVRLVEPGDILDKMVYAYTNPTAADLVDVIEDWPGVCSFGSGQLVATRPTFFFDPDGQTPETVVVPIVRPQGFTEMTRERWSETVTERVRAVEAEHRERRRLTGKTVLGREEILRQSPFACPEGPASHFRINPRVAAKSKWPRIEALQRNRTFLTKYRIAIKKWMDGLHDVVFPFGTYWMKKFAKVVCEAADTLQELAAEAAPSAAPS